MRSFRLPLNGAEDGIFEGRHCRKTDLRIVSDFWRLYSWLLLSRLEIVDVRVVGLEPDCPILLRRFTELPS